LPPSTIVAARSKPDVALALAVPVAESMAHADAQLVGIARFAVGELRLLGPGRPAAHEHVGRAYGARDSGFALGFAAWMASHPQSAPSPGESVL